MSNLANNSVLQQEIAEQPALVERLLIEPLVLSATQIPSLNVRSLLGVAEGSSRHALEIAAPFIEAWTGLPMRVWDPQTLHNALDCMEGYPSQDGLPGHAAGSLGHTFCLAASQSGETGSLIHSLERMTTVFQPLGLACPAILPVTNTLESTLARRFWPPLWINAQSEKSIAATKTFTATVLLLLRWGLEVGYQFKRISLAQHSAIKADLAAVSPLLQTLCGNDMRGQFAKFCQRLTPELHAPIQHFILLSKGLLASVLPEAGLKLTETSRNIVYTQNSESFKHGPKVMLAGLNEQHPNAVYLVPSNERDATGLFEDAIAHFWAKGQNPETDPPQFLTDRVFWLRFANSPLLPGTLSRVLMANSHQVLILPAVYSPIQAMFSVLVTFQWLSALVAEQRAILPDDPTLSKSVA